MKSLRTVRTTITYSINEEVIYMKRKKKTPQRKCIITNELKPKDEMIRVVRNKEGEVFIDKTGKQNGRGAYLTVDAAIFEQARKTNKLNQVLKTSVDQSIYDKLDELINE